MRVHFMFVVYLMAGLAASQAQEGQVIPSVTAARVEDGSVTVLHLAPGYTTSVRLPEEISSVVIGDPASFKAEHSEAEARLVFFKPTTSQLSESNALITTKSGQEISLHLVSAGKGSANARVDFLIEYRQAQSMVISPDRQSFLIADTRPVSSVASTDSPIQSNRHDQVTKQLERQKSLACNTECRFACSATSSVTCALSPAGGPAIPASGTRSRSWITCSVGWIFGFCKANQRACLKLRSSSPSKCQCLIRSRHSRRLSSWRMLLPVLTAVR